MRVGVNSVQYDRDMWQELGNDVKSTYIKGSR